jgi:N-dimethylarginine dimethylaminohydrolase
MGGPVFLMSYPRRDWGLRGRSNFLSSGGGAVSARGAMEDWLAVADAVEAAGGRVVVMPPSPVQALTGLPYTAEAGEFYRDREGRARFLLSRMRPAHREAEPGYTAGFVAGLGWGASQPAAVWEAQGDTIRVGRGRIVHTSGEGPAARSEAAAFAEVSGALGGEALALRFVADPWFHGNTFLAWFCAPDGSRDGVVVCPEALLEGELSRLRAFLGGTPVVEISREESLGYATNALQVNGAVISPSGVCASVRALWASLGLEVVELGLETMFRRGGGAAVCMTSRLWGLSPEEVPRHARYAAQAASLRASLDQWSP